MIKLEYKAVAYSQIHHGGDENTGTLRGLRREKVQSLDTQRTTSAFTSDKERRCTLLIIIRSVYKSIDHELKAKNYGFYDAFASKLLASTRVRTKVEFLTRLCESCGIRTLRDSDGLSVMNAIDLFSDNELLQTIRNEHQYLMLMLKDSIQNGEASNIDISIDSSLPKQTFENRFNLIPYISGNAIRGVLRRLVIKDWLDLVGLNPNERGVEKEMYHQLMTGGNITGSTAFENLELREMYIKLCPMIGLLGSAIGNMTIQGKLLVGSLRPMCIEHGNGNVSFWENTSTSFNTRHDSSKLETEVNIIEEDDDSKSAPHQMKFEFEVFNKGTTFSGDFVLKSKDSLHISTFWRMMEIWKGLPIVGGKSATGHGVLSTDIDIPKDASELYLEHVKKNSKAATNFFTVAV